MTRIRIIPALLGAAVLAACSKDGVQDITAPTAGAFIKFYNFGVNAPSVNFFANDTKVTAISSTSCTPPTIPPNPLCTSTGIESTTGTAYGAAANGGLYSSIAPGAVLVQREESPPPRTTDSPSPSSRRRSPTGSTTRSTRAASTMRPRRRWTRSSSKMRSRRRSTSRKSSVRFVNASSNSSPMTLYAKNTGHGRFGGDRVVDRVQERRARSFRCRRPCTI